MSIICLSHVMRHSKAKLGGRLVLFVLAEHAHDDGRESYPAVATIAERANMSRRGVQESLRRLEADGEIEPDGVGPRGQSKWCVVMGGADPAPPADDDEEGRASTPEGGAAAAPEPSKGTVQGTEGGTRAGEDVPDDFPDELRPHARAVMRVLIDVAQRHGAKKVTARAVALTIMPRQRKPLVRAAHDFAAHFDGGSRKLRDVVAAYRRWIDREDDLAGPERLGGDAPIAGENVTRLRPNATEEQRRRARQEERLRRATAPDLDAEVRGITEGGS